MKILVIDQDQNFLQQVGDWYQDAKEKWGLQFYFAKNGVEAEAYLKKHSEIDIVVSDVDALNNHYSMIQSRTGKEDRKVILVSENEDISDISSAQDKGAHEHLKKPLRSKDLHRTITKTLNDIVQSNEIKDYTPGSYKKLKNTIEQTIHVISHLCELKDPYTSGHQHRVAIIAKMIGEELHLSEFQIEGIYLAGLLHDIGKMRIPTELLSRPGGLSETEMALIREHPQAGYDVLHEISFPWNIANFVLLHHERLDGSGYPNHRKRNDIPIEARIIAIADVFEAVTSFRPYRPALGVEYALEVLENGKGTLFDPLIVDKWHSVVRSTKELPFAQIK